MEFLLFHDKRENDWVILERVRQQIAEKKTGFLDAYEAQRFLDMAESYGVTSKLLRALQSIVDDPARPIDVDPSGDLHYLVPWVEGPDDFDRPFGLDTKYGHLVFAFVQHDELLESFVEISAESLRDGFDLDTAATLVPRRQQLGPALAERIPSNLSFRLLVQGTEEFDAAMEELAAGTIWD
jgi:hypothetical protein